VKQFEQETNLRAMILVDASRSDGMAWRAQPLTKRAYADRLAAALALILLRQRDATGLITFDEAVREVVPARVKAGTVGPPGARSGWTRRTVGDGGAGRAGPPSHRCSPAAGSWCWSPIYCSSAS